MKINLDSPVIAFLTTVADFMILNILFIICCVPVITIGPAISALYTITMREARHEGGYIFKPFLRHLKIISGSRFFYQYYIVWQEQSLYLA